MHAQAVYIRPYILIGPGHEAISSNIIRRNGLIYWTDSSHGLIMRSNLNGSSVATILRGLVRPG